MDELLPQLRLAPLDGLGVDGVQTARSMFAYKQDVIAQVFARAQNGRIDAAIIQQLSDGSVLAKVQDLTLHLQFSSPVQLGEHFILKPSKETALAIFLMQNGQEVKILNPLKLNNKNPSSRDLSANAVQLSKETVNANGQVLASSAKQHNFASSVGKQSSNTISAQQVSATDVSAIKDTPGAALDRLGLIKNSSEIELSPTAQLIARLLPPANADNSATAHPHIVGKSNLISAETIQTESPDRWASQIRDRLKQTIENSGLFYESHVLAFVRGERTQQSLMSEPQAQLLAEHAQLDARPSSLTNEALNKLDGPLTRIVQQQLSLIDNQNLQMAMQLRPDIPIRWNITIPEFDATQKNADTAHNRQANHEDADAVVSSQLQIDFPKLGRISINLRLQKEQVALNLKVKQAECTDILRGHAIELKTALDQQATRIELFKVEHDAGL